MTCLPKLLLPAALTALLAALATLPGCWPTAATNAPGQRPSGGPPPPDDVFDKGANRPPTPETMYALARLLASQGKDDQAERVLVELVGRRPQFVPAYCDLAELQVRHRRIDDAAQTLSAGLKISPQDPVLLNNLGMCYFLKGHYPKALAVFAQAAGARPEDALYRANMAMILGLLGRYDEAAALYAQILPQEDVSRNIAVLRQARGDRTLRKKLEESTSPKLENVP